MTGVSERKSRNRVDSGRFASHIAPSAQLPYNFCRFDAGGLAAAPAATFVRNLPLMSQLTILEYPDPRLRTKAQPVIVFDAALQALIDAMFETMYAAPGIGLAATQVNVHKQLLVLDVSEEKNRPLVLVNPRIVAQDGSQTYQEGCLSVPGIYADVDRADRITVEALDRNGQPQQIEAEGLLAVCIQHEMDHLVGKLFVDYLSPLKRDLVRRKLEKQRRSAAQA